MMMLELGLIPILYIIKMKRLNYFHHLLNSDDNSIARKVLFQQMKKPFKCDWISPLQEDLDEFQLNMSFDQISSVSKNKWKKIVKIAIKKLTLKTCVRRSLDIKN